MPIRPENTGRYPPDWPQIRARIIRRAGNRCERCKVENGRLGGRLRDGTFCPAVPEEKLDRLRWPQLGSLSWCVVPGMCGHGWEKLRVIRIVLTVAHLNHIIEDCRDENLQALCQRCHLLHDVDLHAQTRYRTRREGKAVTDLFEEPR